MTIRSARFFLLLTGALFCIVGLSLSAPRIAPWPIAGPESPRAAPNAPRTGGREAINTVPKTLTPITHKATCASDGAGCCERTKDWCLGEGYLWQDCKKCFCGSQCLAPDVTEFTQDDGAAAP
ncbi:MAG TPA: hypothetical protein VMQ62_15370 [Dongiaceae bacterium]|nr:hypothetical protein [Dongiaceae bacterium]